MLLCFELGVMEYVYSLMLWYWMTIGIMEGGDTSNLVPWQTSTETEVNYYSLYNTVGEFCHYTA